MSLSDKGAAEDGVTQSRISSLNSEILALLRLPVCKLFGVLPGAAGKALGGGLAMDELAFMSDAEVLQFIVGACDYKLVDVFDALHLLELQSRFHEFTTGAFALTPLDAIAELSNRYGYEPIGTGSFYHDAAVGEVWSNGGIWGVNLSGASTDWDGFTHDVVSAWAAATGTVGSRFWYHGTTWADAVALWMGGPQVISKVSLDFGPGFYLGDSLRAALQWANRGWGSGQRRERAVVVYAIPDDGDDGRVNLCGPAVFTHNAADRPAWALTVQRCRCVRREIIVRPNTTLAHGTAQQRQLLNTPDAPALFRAVQGPICCNPGDGAGAAYNAPEGRRPEDLYHLLTEGDRVVQQLKVCASGFSAVHPKCRRLILFVSADGTGAAADPVGGAGEAAGSDTV